MRIVQIRSLLLTLSLCVIPLASCGDDDGSPPEGSCKTGGTATGSYSAACNQCGKDRCNAELSNYAGSGWARQYFGGNGACAAFDACVCKCLSSKGDPLDCATTACFESMTDECQAAALAATDCINAKCDSECR